MEIFIKNILVLLILNAIIEDQRREGKIMGLYKIDKNISLLDGKSIAIDIDIPFSGEIDENGDYSFIEDIIVQGLYREAKGVLDGYQQSELPNKFIERQKMIITNNLPDSILGVCDVSNDIYLDADAMQGIRNIKPKSLFAHEVGHKILKYIDNIKALEDIGDFLGLKREYHLAILAEIFAEACGNIVSDESCYNVLGEKICVDHYTNEAIKQKTLYNIYHV